MELTIGKLYKTKAGYIVKLIEHNNNEVLIRVVKTNNKYFGGSTIGKEYRVTADKLFDTDEVVTTENKTIEPKILKVQRLDLGISFDRIKQEDLIKK